MEVYNQQYSEIDNIPVVDAIFLQHYYEDRKKYEEFLHKQEMAKVKNTARRRR